MIPLSRPVGPAPCDAPSPACSSSCWLPAAGRAGLHYSGETVAELPAHWRGFLLDHRALRLAGVPPGGRCPASFAPRAVRGRRRQAGRGRQEAGPDRRRGGRPRGAVRPPRPTGQGRRGPAAADARRIRITSGWHPTSGPRGRCRATSREAGPGAAGSRPPGPAAVEAVRGGPAEARPTATEGAEEHIGTSMTCSAWRSPAVGKPEAGGSTRRHARSFRPTTWRSSNSSPSGCRATVGCSGCSPSWPTPTATSARPRRSSTASSPSTR